MFMDGTATSNRLETLVKVLMSDKMPDMDEDTLKIILAPRSLPEFSNTQPTDLLSAGKELGLLTYSKDAKKIQKIDPNGKSAKQKLLEILDGNVLSKTDVEPYFAKYYSFILFNDIELSNSNKILIDLVTEANQKIVGFSENNPFNDTKLSSYLPWYSYVGLTETIRKDRNSIVSSAAHPYERIERKLDDIFQSQKLLQIEDFMQNLGSHCPELDCGEIFNSVNSAGNQNHNQITRGVSNALIELHVNGRIVLDCPLDSDGWSFHSSIVDASLPQEPNPLKSTKIYSVKLEAK